MATPAVAMPFMTYKRLILWTKWHRFSTTFVEQA